MMRRVIEPELLDELPAEDPRAIRSRRDLRVINRWMQNAAHFRRTLEALPYSPKRIVEIGAGDGTLICEIARQFAHQWPEPVELWLVDMQPVIRSDVQSSLKSLGWHVHIVSADIRDWLESCGLQVDLVLANLFLHHFSDDVLRKLFRRLSDSTDAFVSCDPRRWRPALWSTRLLWLLGCNDVTRHDGRISVRAGFRDRELSSLWPRNSEFDCNEYPAGYASHLFQAIRRDRKR